MRCIRAYWNLNYDEITTNLYIREPFALAFINPTLFSVFWIIACICLLMLVQVNLDITDLFGEAFVNADLFSVLCLIAYICLSYACTSKT